MDCLSYRLSRLHFNALNLEIVIFECFDVTVKYDWWCDKFRIIIIRGNLFIYLSRSTVGVEGAGESDPQKKKLPKNLPQKLPQKNDPKINLPPKNYIKNMISKKVTPPPKKQKHLPQKITQKSFSKKC